MSLQLEPWMKNASVKILADSVGEKSYGHRLITFELNFPRRILSELLMYRMAARSGQSSRARPASKTIEDATYNFCEPVYMKKRKGMASWEMMSEEDQEYNLQHWHNSRLMAISAAKAQDERGAHKTEINRILEPYIGQLEIYTAEIGSLEWLFHQRVNFAAHHEFYELAWRMEYEVRNSLPRELVVGEWHIPYYDTVDDADLDFATQVKVSVARTARGSYLTHNGVRDISEDIRLYDQLKEEEHFSPFEPLAQYLPNNPSGCFKHYRQLRHRFKEQYIKEMGL